MRISARSSLAGLHRHVEIGSTCASSVDCVVKRSWISSRRRMIAAVARLSLVYFSIIEPMAFS